MKERKKEGKKKEMKMMEMNERVGNKMAGGGNL